MSFVGMVFWMMFGPLARAESVDAEMLKDLDFFMAMDALETIEPEFPLEEAKEKK
jgi:hypothetical protein